MYKKKKHPSLIFFSMHQFSLTQDLKFKGFYDH